MSRAFRIVMFLVLAVIVGGALVWWQYLRPATNTSTAMPGPATAQQSPPTPVVIPTPAPSAPAIRYPVAAAPAPRAVLPSLDRADAYVEKALVELLGRKAVQSFLHLDGFARNFVATVNNLGTENASAQMWPVNRTAGKLDTEMHDGGLVIGASNANRYAAFVRFADRVDTQRAVALYVRLYPLFQRAYEELGYPGKYFNDRVVEVIDNLLATPTPTGPIAVKRFTADGGSSGGGLYVFVDPALETSPAGQKILLRMGRDNAASLTAKLREIRALLVARPPAER
jgi:hypothetical protein